MRIWHKWLLSALPDRKIIAQWRDCCTVARNIDIIGIPNDVLIDKPISKYPLSHLYAYSMIVIEEMNSRGIAVSTVSFANFEKHIFSAMEKMCDALEDLSFDEVFALWHAEKYFWTCINALLEEYYFCEELSDEEWDKIEEVSQMYTHPEE